MPPHLAVLRPVEQGADGEVVKEMIDFAVQFPYSLMFKAIRDIVGYPPFFLILLSFFAILNMSESKVRFTFYLVYSVSYFVFWAKSESSGMYFPNRQIVQDSIGLRHAKFYFDHH